MIESLWMNHAYDYFALGNEVIVVTPDGHIITALHITHDRFRTEFTVTGVSMIDGRSKTHTFNEYEYAMVDTSLTTD